MYFRYHNDKMVNYDLQNGFSVSSIQSQHHHSASSKIQNHIRDSGAAGNGNDRVNSNLTNTIVSIPQTSYLVAPTTSILTLKEVSFKHVGNYTCAPSNAKQTSITVHVLRGNNLQRKMKLLLLFSFFSFFLSKIVRQRRKLG